MNRVARRIDLRTIPARSRGPARPNRQQVAGPVLSAGRPWFLATLVAAALVAPLASGQSPDDTWQSSEGRFIAGLRQRQLFFLADQYCQQRLTKPDLPQARRAELVAQLSQTLAQWALASPPAQREPLWQRAWQCADTFVREHPQDPSVPVVWFQGIESLLARGELARQESQLVADGRALLEEARTWLRESIRQLQALGQHLEQLLRRRGPLPTAESTARDAGPSLTAVSNASQLLMLQRNVLYELARAYRNQGEAYPADSPDRAHSLTQAVQVLEPLAAVQTDDAVAGKSRLDLVVCQRLLGDLPAARRRLEAFQQQRPAPPLELRARAEELRLALAARDAAAATAALDKGRQSQGQTAPELDYAWLDAFLTFWRSAHEKHDQANAQRWKDKALQQAELIADQHGLYWARRAQMLLASFVQAAPDTQDLGLLTQAAENAFRSGQLDDALAAYDRVRALAQTQGDRQRAFDAAYLAAAIEHRRQRHAQALERFRQTVDLQPDSPRAAEAFELAAYHAGQLARDRDPAALTTYADLLQQYLQRWPHASGAGKIRWQLARLNQLQTHWPQAIDLYRSLPADDPRFAQALDAVDECYRAWMAQQRAAAQPVEPTIAAAAGWFESLVLGPQQRLPEQWSPVARHAALAASRWWLETPAGYERASQLLSAALASATDADEAWRASARALLVLALAGQSRHREADEVLAQISTGPVEHLLLMLEGLEGLAAGTNSAVRRELAELELRAVTLLQQRPAELKPEVRQAVDRAAAQALADAGRSREAQAAYQRLAQTYPHDGRIQEAYAQWLSAQPDRNLLKTALQQWALVAQKSDPGKPRWFRAQYALADLHFRLGDPAHAARLITRLQILYPELGGPEMRRKFSALFQQCRQ